jgi:hypothetical protein
LRERVLRESWRLNSDFRRQSVFELVSEATGQAKKATKRIVRAPAVHDE